MHAAVGGVGVGWIFVYCHRGPDAVEGSRHGETKGGRHDTDNGEQLVTEIDASPNNGGVAGKLRGPKRMTDQPLMASRLLFPGQKSAPQFRPDTQRRQQVPSDDLRIYV